MKIFQTIWYYNTDYQVCKALVWHPRWNQDLSLGWYKLAAKGVSSNVSLQWWIVMHQLPLSANSLPGYVYTLIIKWTVK